MKKIAGPSLLCFFAILIYGCASSSQPIPHYEEQQEHYTTAFPSKGISENLSNIQQSIQRIATTAVYSIYLFGNQEVTTEKLERSDLDSLAVQTLHIDRSSAGTAISILQDDLHTVFITASHITEFPDTLISYKEGQDIPEHTYIQSISILADKNTYLFVDNSLVKVKILATNTTKDLALLKANRQLNEFKAPPLFLKTGSAKNLQLGSFVYTMGYPLGTPMVTTGIVSAPNYDSEGSFLMDALFNKGISGGIIIASQNDYESFDWVGMSSTASASNDYYLIPDPSKKQYYHDLDVYTDTVFVKEESTIHYGIARAIPIESILNFIFSNEKKLNSIGLSATELRGQ